MRRYWSWWLESEPLLTRLASLTATEATPAELRRQTALQFIEQRDLPSSSIYGASAPALWRVTRSINRCACGSAMACRFWCAQSAASVIDCLILPCARVAR